MSNEEIDLSKLSKTEIVEAILEPKQQPANSLEESADELRAMGIPDISDADDKQAMAEAMKNIQITKVLDDARNANAPKKSVKDVLENHAKFLLSVSPGKTINEIVQSITVDHAYAVLKTTEKREVDTAVLKKHLKTLKKKYS